jgi:hypothetical protein
VPLAGAVGPPREVGVSIRRHRPEQPGPDECGSPDARAEQRAAQRPTRLVGEDQVGLAEWVPVEVRPQDRDEPAR